MQNGYIERFNRTFREDVLDAYLFSSFRQLNVLAEKWITGTELTVAILNGKALPVIRLDAKGEFYDFNAKYASDETAYICPCGLPAELEAEVQELAVRAFDVAGCSGWGRHTAVGSMPATIARVPCFRVASRVCRWRRVPGRRS